MSRWKTVVPILGPGLIWGSEWFLTRGLDAPVFGGLALRYGLAALMLGGVIAVRGISLPAHRQLGVSVAAGIGFLILPVVLTGWAGERISPGLSVVILSLAPLLAALMEGRASGALLAPLVGGVGGTAVLASQGLSFAATQWMGAGAALLAAVSIAASVVAMKRELAEVSPVAMAAIQLGAGSIGFAALSLFVEGRAALDWSWRSAGSEGILAIAGSVLGLPVYYRVLKRMESFQLTATQWVITLTGLAESSLAVGAAPGWRTLAGAAILIASGVVLLVNRPADDALVTLQSMLPPSAR